MDERRKRGRRWCRIILKIGLVLTVCLLLAFFALQAALASSWLRGKVAEKLSSRIGGLPVAIDRLGWTPWSGVTVKGLKVGQPTGLAGAGLLPLLEVDRIHASPDYVAAMERQWRVHELTIEKPRVHLSVELLAALAAELIPKARPPEAADELAIFSDPMPEVPGLKFQAVDPDVMEPTVVEEVVDSPIEKEWIPEDPVVDEVPVTPAPVKDAMKEPEIVDERAVDEEEIPGEDVPVPVLEKVVRVEVEKVSSPPGPPPLKPFRLRIEEGAFDLVHVGGKTPLLRIGGGKFDLPLFEEDRSSGHSIERLEFLGETVEENLEIELEYRNRDYVLKLLGDEKKSGLSGQVLLGVKGGLPVHLDLKLQMKSFGPVEWGESLTIESGVASAQLRGGGWLFMPNSLNGVSDFKLENVSAEAELQSFDFDLVSGGLQLYGGLLQSPDVRLISDGVSLLGNGWVTSREGAAVLRVVVPTTSVQMIKSEFGKMVPEGDFVFRPLRTRNRWYADVSAWREELGWMFEFGDGGVVIPISELRGGE